MKRKLSFFVALVAAWVMVANVQAAYTVKFADMPHCTWTASYNGSPFTGGDVELGKTLIVNYEANPSWRFTANDLKTWTFSKTLQASDFVSGVYTVAQPDMYQPGFKMEVRYIGDGSEAKIMWEDKSGDLKTYRLMVSESQDPGNPDFWKNAYNTTANEQVVSGLAVDNKYYAHLQGGVDADHMSPEVFTYEFDAKANIAPCGLRVHMWDSYGDGWNGAYIEIVEDGVTTEFTLEAGKEGWAEYISTGADATVTWRSGSYDDEIRFAVFNGDGEELVYIEDAGYELSDGTVMKSGILCDYPCAVQVTNLDFTSNADKTEYTITWDATGAENFQVAVLQKYAPTDAELEKAAKAVSEKSYKISGKANAIQHVYVRAVCDDGTKGGWADDFICDPVSNTLAPKEILPKLAKEVKVPFTEKGDFLANAVGIGSSSLSWSANAFYHFTLAEKTSLMISFSSTVPKYFFYTTIYMDPGEGKDFIDLGGSEGGTIDLDPGSYYIAVAAQITADDYTFKIAKATEPTFTTISALNYFDEGDFTNAKYMDVLPGYNYPAQAYSYQPTEDQETFVLLNSSNLTGSVYCAIYEDETQIAVPSAPYQLSSLNMTAGKTYTFYIFPYLGHKASITDSYQFFLGLKSDEPTQTKRINLDAHITDKITKDDVVNELGSIGKVYEFVLKENTPVACSIEVLGEKANDENLIKGVSCNIYKSEISGTAVLSIGAEKTYWGYETLDGESSGTHYYAVVGSAYGLDFDYRVDLRAKTPANDIKGKQTIELNKGYQSGLSSLDPFRNDGEGTGCSSCYGSVEYYTVHLEASRRYLVLVHKLMDISTDKVSRFATTILDPNKTGSFTDRTVQSTTTVNDDWEVIDFTPTSTGDYTLVFGAVQYKQSAQDTLAYQFSVEQVTYVEYATPTVVSELPYKEDGTFTNNQKIVPSTTYHFQDKGTSWIQKNGAYDALGLLVKVAAGDSLWVEFGGAEDVAIYIYDGTSSPLAVIDNEPYAYPYEKGGIKNTSSSEKSYSVVCTYNTVTLLDQPYYVRLSNHANDFAPQVATAKLNQTYVNIPADGGIADAQAALAQLVITAYNGAGEAIGTIVNRGDLWNVNLNENKASYELNDSDLPLGYKFAKTPLFLQASLRRKDVHIEEVVISESQDGAVRKVLRNGLIMIDTPYGSFDIMGRRVR